ncbi:MAG: LysR family transcriptional regulator [Sedimentisphaerales bacterium]|nr:LysR family transcriptional regulator [Sedimentisphaerales bacterium]
MHIETLKAFCDLVELQSFSKTADRHLLSQSAISQQLAQLEMNHKAQLIDRNKRPFELTNAGQHFYKAAKDILERYEQLKSELNTLKSSSGSRLNIAAIFSIGMHTLQPYVKKFMIKFPNVNTHIEFIDAEKIYELVLEGEADIGLVAVAKKDKRLEVYDFETEPLVLVCSPRHILANEQQVDIHDVQFERFIAFEEGIPTREWINNILNRYNVKVRPVMEFDNIETIKRAVEINTGISIMPKPSISQEVASGTLKAIFFTNEEFFRPTGIIVRKNKLLGQPGRYFIELLRKKAK